MKVLFVEDDIELAWTVKTGLERNGAVVDWVKDGLDGAELSCLHNYDIVVLDIMLPSLDGFAILKRIRSSKISTPVLILTARNNEYDRVRGLDLGADDYLVKPFSYPELYARIRALIRRSNNVVDSILAIGDLSINTVNKKVYFENREIILTSREYAILEYLVYNKGAVVTQQMIEDHVWGYDSEAYSNVVAVLVMRIRKKLCPNNKEKVITTARGFGYVIQDP